LVSSSASTRLGPSAIVSLLGVLGNKLRAQVDVSIRSLFGSPGCTRSCDWSFLAQKVTIATICGSARSSRSLEGGLFAGTAVTVEEAVASHPTVTRWLLRRKRWVRAGVLGIRQKLGVHDGYGIGGCRAVRLPDKDA
jgi:hypothetical protein